MYGIVKERIDETSIGIINRMPAWSGVYNPFIAKYNDLSDYFEIQVVNREGLREAKVNKRESATIAGLIISSKLAAFARSINDDVLFAEVDYRKSDLTSLTDTELVPVLENILAKAIANLSFLIDYEITVAVTDDFSAKIESYKIAKPKPKMGIQTKKEATAGIKITFTEADAYLDDMDVLVRSIQYSEPAFYNRYFIARKIDEPAHRQLLARGKVVDRLGEPIPFVTMVCETLNIDRRITTNGTFFIKSGKNGPHLITYSRPMYRTVTQEVNLYHSTRVEVTIVMEAL